MLLAVPLAEVVAFTGARAVCLDDEFASVREFQITLQE
jgi:hypothetical protein